MTATQYTEEHEVLTIERDDYARFLAEYGFAEDAVRAVVEDMADHRPMPAQFTKLVPGASRIEGQGMFAAADIKASELVAPARINARSLGDAADGPPARAILARDAVAGAGRNAGNVAGRSAGAAAGALRAAALGRRAARAAGRCIGGRGQRMTAATDLEPWHLMLAALAGDAPHLVHGSQRGRIHVCSSGKPADGDSGFCQPQRAREAGAPTSKELGFAARPARAKQSPNHGQALAQIEQAMRLRPQPGCTDA